MQLHAGPVACWPLSQGVAGTSSKTTFECCQQVCYLQSHLYAWMSPQAPV
jgi:hypothetical protein